MLYIKLSKEVGRTDNCQAFARQLSFLPANLDIFDIRQHYVCILFIFKRPICRSLLLQTAANTSVAVYGYRLGVIMRSCMMLTAS